MPLLSEIDVAKCRPMGRLQVGPRSHLGGLIHQVCAFGFNKAVLSAATSRM